ncbi:hypothetical protein [Velocimicrobium porci]|uniref:Uncharacterized protein n=1 Tax=Velocimicrobium porci TaxID=2606634 RepID=A0A6L5XWH3_9FIRM|nr:hypothetical protein [Velocimicrobium porci]MSS63165.1 hypothetical protein [Velocimicrobium porci]
MRRIRIAKTATAEVVGIERIKGLEFIMYSCSECGYGIEADYCYCPDCRVIIKEEKREEITNGR